MLLPDKTLVRYIGEDLDPNRNGTPRRRGVLVAVPVDDQHFSVGFAFCHPQDQFRKHRGLEIAINRAIHGSTAQPPKSLQHHFKVELELFLKRCSAYYQGKHYQARAMHAV